MTVLVSVSFLDESVWVNLRVPVTVNLVMDFSVDLVVSDADFVVSLVRNVFINVVVIDLVVAETKVGLGLKIRSVVIGRVLGFHLAGAGPENTHLFLLEHDIILVVLKCFTYFSLKFSSVNCACVRPYPKECRRKS